MRHLAAPWKAGLLRGLISEILFRMQMTLLYADNSRMAEPYARQKPMWLHGYFVAYATIGSLSGECEGLIARFRARSHRGRLPVAEDGDPPLAHYLIYHFCINDKPNGGRPSEKSFQI